MKVLGNDLGNKNIIDYACGEGHYTRKIRELTQGVVIGVDISPEMVELAQSQQDKEGSDINYRVSDCCRAEFLEEFKDNFDVVTATYLLNYATNVDMIQSFTDSAFTVLQPGGRFIGINTNPFIKTREDFLLTHKYDI